MGVQRTAVLDVQNAVNETGFGKFNLRLMAVCSLMFMNTGFSISSIALVLPSASCDLKMSTADKGRLNAAPMLGMVVGAYFWGCLADVKGRKVAMLSALFFHGASELLSSIIPDYWVFLFLKFLGGLGISGQSAIVFPYLGEFQPTKFREKMLCWMEMAWSTGLIVLPLVGWAVIPLKIDWSTYIPFRSWNLFVLICSMPSLLIAVWFFFFPESPKYLIEDGQEIKALEILAKMYSENTGNPPEKYLEKYIECEGISMSEALKRAKEVAAQSTKPEEKKKSFGKMAKDILVDTATILKPPYLKKTAIASTIQFSVTSSYYTLMLWFPELFQRFAEFEEVYSGQSASVCSVSLNKTLSTSIDDLYGCQAEIQPSVYLNTIFLGLACIPTSIWLPLCIGWLGYRFYLVFTTVVSSAVTVGLYFVTSSTQNLILSCAFEALTSLCVSVVYCVLVDLFPTNLRVMAAAFSAFCGRSGALVGNLMFGYLIDIHCIVPIAVVASQLLLSGVLALFIPGKKKMKAIAEHSV